MNFNNEWKPNQLHIGIFGKRNSGKSTLINALTGQNTAFVSSVAVTTTDPVYKMIELHGIGSCVLIDTAGFDDNGYLENMRTENTRMAMEKTDVALIVCSEEDIAQEIEWAREFKSRYVPVVMVINKIDQISNTDKIRKKIFDALKQEPIKISAISRLGIEKIQEEIVRNIPEDFEARCITRDLTNVGDTVLIIMPQSNQITKGHLNVSLIKTIRELLDKNCIVINSTIDNLEAALASLANPPKLIITDATVFSQVSYKKPEESKITSFSSLYTNN